MKSGVTAAVVVMLAAVVVAPAFAQWYLPEGDWVAGDELGSYHENVYDEKGNLVGSNWIYSTHDDDGNFLEWEWFLPVHNENWELYEWISLVPMFDRDWDFLEYDLYVYDLDLNLVEHVEGFSMVDDMPVGSADDIPVEYLGRAGPSDRELELHDLYGPDEIYRYAAWLEDNSNHGAWAQTTIYNSTIFWTFTDSKGNLYEWNLPIVDYEDLIGPSRELSAYQYEMDNKWLETSTGRTLTTPNFDIFVRSSFSDVIDEVYDNATDDYDFIHEVWYIVSQMTTYETDVNITSEGRYALETFTRGGGDCEDLAILVADMLKSSSRTKDWKIQLVYMDTERLDDPQTVDHVIVYVNTGQHAVNIEATGESDMYRSDFSYYPDTVKGWYYDV